MIKNKNFKQIIQDTSEALNDSLIITQGIKTRNQIEISNVETVIDGDTQLIWAKEGETPKVQIEFTGAARNSCSVIFNRMGNEGVLYVFNNNKFGGGEVIKATLYINLDTYELLEYKDGDFTEISQSKAGQALGKMLIPEVRITTSNESNYLGFKVVKEFNAVNFVKDFIGQHFTFNFRLTNSPITYTYKPSKSDFTSIFRSLKNQEKYQNAYNKLGFDDLNYQNIDFEKGLEGERGAAYSANKLQSYVFSKNNLVAFAIFDRMSPQEVKDLPMFFIVFDEDGNRYELLRTASGILIEKEFSDSKYMMDQYVVLSNSVLTETNMKYKKDIVNILLKRKELSRIGKAYEFSFALAIFRLLDDSIYDQLFRIGYERLVLSAIMQRTGYNPRGRDVESRLESYIGKIDYKKKKLTGKMGISPSQLEFFKSVSNQNVHTIKVYKQILTGDDKSPMSSFSQEELDVIHDALENAYQKDIEASMKETLDELIFVERVNYTISILKNAHEVSGFEGLKGAVKFMDDISYNRSLLEHYDSYLRLYANLYELIDFRYEWTIHSLTDLDNRIRDLSIYMSELKDDLTREQFEKRSHALSKYEVYDEKSGYMIVSPKKQSDFVNEGVSLGHCVASYSDRYKDGRSTILFVRSIKEPMVPLYTLEIGDGNHIKQLYGKGNSRPPREVRTFVERHLANIK